MERVIYKHVYNYLQQNKLIYEYQSGFLPKHSTQFVGYLLWWSDLLNIICKGNAILFGHSFNILWLMTSGPDALFENNGESYIQTCL
jgi:hypothetical protein